MLDSLEIDLFNATEACLIDELVKMAESVPDATLGLIKEELLRSGRFEAAMNGVAAIMNLAGNDETAGAAFRWLHFSYRAATKNHLQRKLYVADGEDLDDVTQTIWVSIWASRHSFLPGAPFPPWMWTIVNRRTNEWLEKWFRQWSKLESIEDHSSLRERPAGATDSESLLALRQAIQLLPRKHKRLIQLRLTTDHCSLEQIALTMELQLSTVKTLNARAMQRLRELLSGHAIPKRNTNSSRQGRTNHV